MSGLLHLATRTARHGPPVDGHQALLELQAILENATVGIMFTRNRLLVQVNPLCARMFGYEPEELLGQPGRILYPSDEDFEAAAERAGPALSVGGAFQTELDMRRKEGSTFRCRVSAKAVDPLHPQAGTIWIMEDVTEDSFVFEALQQSSRELSAIFETAFAGIAVVRGRRLMRCNRRFEELLGWGRGELTGESTRCWYVSGADYATMGQEALADLSLGRTHQREQTFRRKNGSTFVGRMSGTAFDPENPNEGSVWLLEDVTARRQAEERVRQALAEQEMIFDNAAVGIMFVRNRRVQRCNRKLEEIFGWSAGELAGRSMRVLYPSEAEFADHGAESDEAMARDGAYVGELRLKRKQGGYLWVRATGRRASGTGGDFDIIWIIEDVTVRRDAEEALRRAHDQLEQRVRERTTELTAANSQLQKEIFERLQAEQRIWQVAHHDALTGLPNRALLHDRLEQALAQGLRDGSRVAVMFLDLDRFKSINDSLGHAAGDQLLKEVAGRLGRTVRAVDTVSRLGGDEFIIVLREIGHPDDAVLVAEKILGALAMPVQVLGHELRATPSIGISVFPEDGSDALQLMKNADTAMYHAKAAGRNTFQFFAPRMNEEATRFFLLEQQLRRAVEAGELLLHYQPQVNLDGHTVCGLEALVRWRHPEQGLRSPAEFIPVAEETGIILSLGEWVLAEALQQNRRWQEAGRPALPVAVNLSPRQFRQKSLVETVRQLLKETGQPARLLELEITEGTLMHDVDDALEKLRELAAMGVRLAIDDFGTGYSSLNHLKRLPVHKLKIDQSFVRDLGVDWDNAAIVSAIVSLARALNLETLAEGVETDAQLAMLVNYGCHKFQGYLFSRPLAADQADRLFLLPDLSRQRS